MSQKKLMKERAEDTKLFNIHQMSHRNISQIRPPTPKRGPRHTKGKK